MRLDREKHSTLDLSFVLREYNCFYLMCSENLGLFSFFHECVKENNLGEVVLALADLIYRVNNLRKYAVKASV